MGSRFRVLIVEDSTFFSQLLKEALQDQFPLMEIDKAGNSTEALQKIQTLLPELIFIDIGLPGEDGLKLAKKIKNQYPDAIMIILTAHDLPEYREAALQYTDHFLSKGSSTKRHIFRLVESTLSTHGFSLFQSKNSNS